eukprot:3583119-Pyramimonas_sp.AAC.1
MRNLQATRGTWEHAGSNAMSHQPISPFAGIAPLTRRRQWVKSNPSGDGRKLRPIASTAQAPCTEARKPNVDNFI